ncbi:MAG: hypothetical protein FKY71_17000 [Spiribacter salinus]|uniref:Uncharacterized protein n=1 Tax=Spiribacter salinus TaxID=1335746 RepID=A0A540VG55_9GAMM|nr:MAG: hypothetical protein FKY71_17000 [Spiribacter salinus]
MYRRHELTTGLGTERGNLARDAKGNLRVVTTTRENTDTRDRGGATRSSEEALVMSVERRGCVIWPDDSRQPTRSGGA